MTEQGWFTDPYGCHDARWFSDGVPTSLVRDGTIESYDDPPAGPAPETPRPITSSMSTRNRDDTHRADEPQDGSVRDRMTDAGSSLW
jgi:hypothetical protein